MINYKFKIIRSFSEKLQETNDSLEQPIVASFAIAELRDKHHYFKTSELDTVERLKNPHHWLLRDLAQINTSQYTFFFTINCIKDCNKTTN